MLSGNSALPPIDVFAGPPLLNAARVDNCARSSAHGYLGSSGRLPNSWERAKVLPFLPGRKPPFEEGAQSWSVGKAPPATQLPCHEVDFGKKTQSSNFGFNAGSTIFGLIPSRVSELEFYAALFHLSPFLLLSKLAIAVRGKGSRLDNTELRCTIAFCLRPALPWSSQLRAESAETSLGHISEGTSTLFP